MTKTNIVWLVCRRDHDGNRDVVLREDGKTWGWNLTEDEASHLVVHVQRDHTKVHGQMYDKLSYEKGTLWDFIGKENLRV